jgi:hypothetical protein
MDYRYLRIISATIIISLLLSVFACSDKSQTTEAATETEAATTEAVTEESLSDYFPATDLEGYNYRILATGENNIPTIFSDTQDGNLVNDAVYTKIKTVEDYLNIAITLAEASTTAANADDSTVIKKAILAGEDSFDIVQGHDVSMANLSLENMFVDAYTLPHLDFTQPWWSPDTIESMTVVGRMYLMSNNIAYFNLASTRVMFFNKTIFDNLNIAYPYADVNNGTWTLDVLNGYAKQAYQDLNGDSSVDDGDRFGIVNPKYYYCWLEPFKVEPYVKDNDGRLSYSFDLDKMQAITDQFYNLLFGGYGFNATDSIAANKVFCDGNSMFIYENLSNAVTSYSFSNVIYGILPMPMLDESQKSYYGGCTDRPVAVPVTATNLENTGLITEALNFEGYKLVFPAYYEIALKSRYADQTDDANMIDIVHNNVIMSFTYLYGNYTSPYSNMFETLFNAKTPSTDVASYAAKNEKAQTKRVETIMKYFDKASES